jgi:hypothetical protein
LQNGPLNAPPPTTRLRAGALVVSGFINIVGALVVLFAMPGHATDERIAAAWALVQFLSGVWAGVLGANSPFLHGVVAGLPALALGLAFAGRLLPGHYIAISWALAPVAALIAAAMMRFMRRRR